MEGHDDDLRKFEAYGGLPLPPTNDHGYVGHDGSEIWYACYGSGLPVILLHGGSGHSGNGVIRFPRWSGTVIAPFCLIAVAMAAARATRDRSRMS
jgi:hypothetical protein